MKASITCAVVGARGYLGREAVRLLAAHPQVEAVRPIGSSHGGDYGDDVPSLAHLGLTVDGEEAAGDVDVILTATPAGQSDRFVDVADATGATVIDLSRDHRAAAIAGEGWHYGLADVDPPVPGIDRIANPGCYPTAALLSILPVTTSGLAAEGPIIVDGKSGVSGAGVTPRADLHFPAMAGSTRAYAVASHDHAAEIRSRLSASSLRFTPHLVPQSRGLLTTSYVPAGEDVTVDDVAAAYGQAQGPFVRVVVEPDTAVVAHSNQAHIACHLDREAGLLVCRAAIDNLVKGGAGQAVQNMNHAFGFDVQAGLGQTGGGI